MAPNTKQLPEKWRQWLLNSAFSAALALGGLYYNSVESKHAREAEETNKFRTMQIQENARQDREIAILQTEIKNLTSMLLRMEAKIDQLPSRINR